MSDSPYGVWAGTASQLVLTPHLLILYYRQRPDGMTAQLYLSKGRLEPQYILKSQTTTLSDGRWSALLYDDRGVQLTRGDAGCVDFPRHQSWSQ